LLGNNQITNIIILTARALFITFGIIKFNEAVTFSTQEFPVYYVTY